ncbi:HAD family hydrolase [Ferruginibacter sp.]|uniref:HAD-IIIC family phosphatase n=1 Tax=Ferruginibacter sp. TaxID=1940288 RepID=UPI0019943061|nr:HAD-IIIC family phosphatase [Ferruginibacter sp.]MBC7629001.1 HAD-IIIC family phosphatase [Ferruginibacter sp.]
MSFQHLKKNLKKDFTGLRSVKFALLGDSATQFLAMAIRGSGHNAGLDIGVYEADYDLIYETVLDPESKIYKDNFDYIILFHSSEKLVESFYKAGHEEQKNFAEKKDSYFRNIIATIQKNCKAGIIISNFPEINDSVFGNFASKTPSSFLNRLRKINISLQDIASETKNVFIADISSLVNNEGRKHAVSAKWYITSHNVFVLDFLPVVAKCFTDVIAALSGKFKKALILDLDNTMWGGIIGDDGIENIEIGELGIGLAFTQLQYWAKELKKRGILIGICSKNDEHIAKEVFEKHPDMILRMEDISIFIANWSNKGDNIKYIQEVLNIGMDSIVFIDDNPFERNLVRTMCPEVTVPELPEDPADYLSYLQSLNLFETVSHTEEDAFRTKQYQEETKRVVMKQSFESVDEYLASLEMEAKVESINSFNLARCAQLTQRSNQFNLTTLRYTEEQLKNFIKKGGKAICISLKDKFGDYGLISLLLLEKKDNTMHINTWIMSCRVLKRGVEELAINEAVQLGQQEGCSELHGIYLPTAKNGMVKLLYSTMGFEQINDRESRLKCTNFAPLKSFIKKADDIRTSNE